jgi:hypothetical protein
MKPFLRAFAFVCLTTLGWAQTQVVGNEPDFSLDCSPTQIASDQNDYDHGCGQASTITLRLSTDASRSITGFANGLDGKVLIIHNVGSNSLGLTDASLSSVAANRMELGGNQTIAAEGSIELRYDATSSRWRIKGGSGGGSSLSGGTDTYCTYWTGASTVGADAGCVFNSTTNSMTLTGTITATSFTGSASNGGIDFTEGTGASLTAAASHGIVFASSTSHRLHMNLNNVGAVQVVGSSTTAATSGNCVKFAANGYDVADQGGLCGNGVMYTLMNPSTQAGPADSTTYYVGIGGVATATHNNVRYYVQKACTIKSVSYSVYTNGTLSTSDNTTIDIWVNGAATATGTSTTVDQSAVQAAAQMTGLSYALAAGDYITMRIQTPAWNPTNPTNVFYRADVYCE